MIASPDLNRAAGRPPPSPTVYNGSRAAVVSDNRFPMERQASALFLFGPMILEQEAEDDSAIVRRAAKRARMPRVVAVLNLIATYLGGTLLSVPYAVSQCGIITSLVVLSLAAAAAQFSMNVLCSAARKAQRGSYVEVARVAFGELGAYITTICLLTLTCFLLVGYERLLRDIVRSLVEYVIDDDLSDRAANLVLCLCLLAILPLCLFKQLSALEYTNWVGIAATVVTVLSIAKRSLDFNSLYPYASEGIHLVPNDWTQILVSVPIYNMAFICQFNLLSVYGNNSLTKERMRGVVSTAVSIGVFIYEMMGLFGYTYAYSQTKGDIFANFDASDPLLAVARLGLGLTILMAIPMMVLPCRDALIKMLLDLVYLFGYFVRLVQRGQNSSSRSLRRRRQTYSKIERDKDPRSLQTIKEDEELVVLAEHLTLDGFSPVVGALHIGLTVVVLYGCGALAIAINDVYGVWLIAGSTVSLLVAYVGPCLMYLSLRYPEGFHMSLLKSKDVGCIALLIMSFVSMVMLTKMWAQ